MNPADDLTKLIRDTIRLALDELKQAEALEAQNKPTCGVYFGAWAAHIENARRMGALLKKIKQNS